MPRFAGIRQTIAIGSRVRCCTWVLAHKPIDHQPEASDQKVLVMSGRVNPKLLVLAELWVCEEGAQAFVEGLDRAIVSFVEDKERFDRFQAEEHVLKI